VTIRLRWGIRGYTERCGTRTSEAPLSLLKRPSPGKVNWGYKLFNGHLIVSRETLEQLKKFLLGVDRGVYSRPIMGVENPGPDVNSIKELESMPTANRRYWMNGYMKEYRQGKLRGDVTRRQSDPVRREELRKAQRLQSFKWRIATLLSPQYEILMCVQYEPTSGVYREDNGDIWGFPREICEDQEKTQDCFPILKDFKKAFDVGGRELFKVFVLVKYNRKFNQCTDNIVGVLDKAVLFDSLQQLPPHDRPKWEGVLNKVKFDSTRGEWRPLECSETSWQLFEEYRTICQSLKWTNRQRPKWNSPELYIRLSGWAMEVHRRHRWEHHEALGSSDIAWRVLISPICWCDEIA
jgi:hypothetical protein